MGQIILYGGMAKGDIYVLYFYYQYILHKKGNINVLKCKSLVHYILTIEKIRFRIMIPEFYVIQICKHGRSVAIGLRVKFSANQNSGT